MGRIIAVANQKGGVLVDLDPQGNATMGSGVDKQQLEISSYDLLMNEKPASEVIVDSLEGKYALIPSNSDLTGAEVALLDEIAREVRLRSALETVQDIYDFILIDCPPSLNMLTVNALVAANSVMIPMQCEYYALEGLTGLLETIEKIRKHLNPDLKIEGLLRTMYDPRNNLATQVSAQLIDHFGEKVYRTIIPRNVRLAEAPSHGLTALKYDKSSSGAVAYLALAGEILRREGIAA